MKDANAGRELSYCDYMGAKVSRLKYYDISRGDTHFPMVKT